MAVDLIDVIEVVENTKDFILLEVTGSRKDCILTGVLNGDEELIRVTKGENHVMSIYYKNGNNTSFHWGISGYTLISDGLENIRKAVVDVIQDDLETPLEDTTGKNLIQKKADVNGRDVFLEVLDNKSDDVVIRKNGEFFKRIKRQNADEFISNLIDKKYGVYSENNYISQNGCHVRELELKRVVDKKEKVC